MEIVVKVATSQTLQDVLSSCVKPVIIHFIGHGMREGHSTALVLEDEVGMTRSFSYEGDRINNYPLLQEWRIYISHFPRSLAYRGSGILTIVNRVVLESDCVQYPLNRKKKSSL